MATLTHRSLRTLRRASIAACLFPAFCPAHSGSAPSSARTQARVLRIMPIGDSITYGIQEAAGYEQFYAFPPGGYRPTLFHLLKSENVNFRFAGSVRAGAGPYDWNCEGRPGVTSRGMAFAFPRWDYDHPADIYLLMIGTNDCGYRIPLAQSMHWQRRLWREIFTQNPRAFVLAASITPVRENPTTALTNAWVNTYNAELQRQASAFAAKTHRRLVFVDLNRQSGIDGADFQPSGIHPNSAGYRKMALFWNAALLKYVKQAR